MEVRFLIDRMQMIGATTSGPLSFQLWAPRRGDQQNQLALATYMGIDRTVMTYVIDDLVTAGLVERRPNPADRHRRKIVAAARGVNTLQTSSWRPWNAPSPHCGA